VGGPKRPPTHPHPPLLPAWDEKGTILLIFNFCIHLQTYQDMQLKWCRVMGQKLKYGRPCTHDLSSTHNWLTQPHIASFIGISTKYLMLRLSWKFGWNRCSFGLTHPAACTQARLPLTCGLVHRPPLFSLISSKRIPIDNSRAQDFIDIFKTSWKWLRNFLERGAQKVQTPSSDHPPPTPSDRTHLFINRSLSISGF
jgi:hypothetical protein